MKNCPDCHYEYAATGIECPECGWPHSAKPEPRPVVDRTCENSQPDPVIKVTLVDGYTVRFWQRGLSDEEYIRRATLIQGEEGKTCRRGGCKRPVYADGLCNYHFNV